MSLLKRLFQVHLEVEGWLGYWVGQVVRHINLETHMGKGGIIGFKFQY